MPLSSAPRSLLLLRGSWEDTAQQARWILSALPGSDVLWVGRDPPPSYRVCAPSAARHFLGSSFAAVVLDAHDRLDADALGLLEGLVRRGGAFLLRMGAEAPQGLFARRVLRCIEESEALRKVPASTLAPVEEQRVGTKEQAAAVEILTSAFLAPTPSILALVAERGRGKSSALGLALAAARAHLPSLDVAVCSASSEGVGEILRFAGAVPSFAPT
ncbi:MAG: DUF1726 domain-containing protein, partial [Myxococcales bacterium]|nr:DUF1726 domain-containing protein [Polyangiaceae bacterium]MDW8249949.1 DUF1726 domain-containing protein [Myxococcales bacterium]